VFKCVPCLCVLTMFIVSVMVPYSRPVLNISCKDIAHTFSHMFEFDCITFESKSNVLR
jgi:hypothetical protein